MKSTSILGVRVDEVNLDDAVSLILSWIGSNRKRYIVTPNIEIIMAARKNTEFKSILNKADLSIPDSARLGWAKMILREKFFVKKLFLWPLFLFPQRLFSSLPVTTGTDLMVKLAGLSKDKGFTIGLLGGREGVAEKAGECLKREYPGVKISFARMGGLVDKEGISLQQDGNFPACEILFVTFGHIKQERWIVKNMDKTRAKIFIGVGGAFDYISGGVKRAPEWMRILGLEWLFRLVREPWRIKRFGALIKFVFLILLNPASNLDR